MDVCMELLDFVLCVAASHEPHSGSVRKNS